MISHFEGMVKALPGLEEIRALPSLYLLHIKVEAGSKLVKTTDLLTLPGTIRLVHKDPSVIEQDYHKIREIEKSRLYDLV
jgi:hypothetical protein